MEFEFGQDGASAVPLLYVRMNFNDLAFLHLNSGWALSALR